MMGEPFDRAEVDRLVLGAAALMEELLDESSEIDRTHRLALAAQRRSHALEKFHADQKRLWAASARRCVLAISEDSSKSSSISAAAPSTNRSTSARSKCSTITRNPS